MYYDFPEIENLIRYDIWKAYFDEHAKNAVNWESKSK